MASRWVRVSARTAGRDAAVGGAGSAQRSGPRARARLSFLRRLRKGRSGLAEGDAGSTAQLRRGAALVAVGTVRDPYQKVAGPDDIRRTGVGAGNSLLPVVIPIGPWADRRRERKAWRAFCGRSAGCGWRSVVQFVVGPVVRLAVRAAEGVGAAAAKSVLLPYCAVAADGSRQRSWSLCRECRSRQDSHC